MAYKDKLPILKNFVEMGITQDVSSVDTTIYVSNASLFPVVVPGADYIPCVIRWSGSTREVVHVTAVNTTANTITVERGQEGTAAQSWPIGSFIYATLTAQAQADLLNNIWIRCRQSDGNAVAITVESAASFSLPGDWTDSLEPMMALRILANDAFLTTENGIYIDSVSYTASTGKTLVGIRGVTLPATVAAVEHSLSSRAISQSKEVQEYRALVERVSANLNESERICTEKAQIAQAAADRLTLSSAIDSTRDDCAATPLAVKTAYDRGSAGIAAAGVAQTAANNALTAADTKLPLAGGTMAGPIVTSALGIIKCTSDNGYITMSGGSQWHNDGGASLTLFGKSKSSTPGEFLLAASDGTRAAGLTGYPDGTLKWNGQRISTIAAAGAQPSTKTISVGLNGFVSNGTTYVSRTEYVAPDDGYFYIHVGIAGTGQHFCSISSPTDRDHLYINDNTRKDVERAAMIHVMRGHTVVIELKFAPDGGMYVCDAHFAYAVGTSY